MDTWRIVARKGRKEWKEVERILLLKPRPRICRCSRIGQIGLFEFVYSKKKSTNLNPPKQKKDESEWSGFAIRIPNPCFFRTLNVCVLVFMLIEGENGYIKYPSHELPSLFIIIPLNCVWIQLISLYGHCKGLCTYRDSVWLSICISYVCFIVCVCVCVINFILFACKSASDCFMSVKRVCKCVFMCDSYPLHHQCCWREDDASIKNS